MAKGDVSIVGGASVTPVYRWDTDDRTTSTLVATIKPGEPVKQSTDFATLLLTAEPTQTVGKFIGIANSESTDSSTADGSVDVSVVVPYVTILRAKATTASNVDTEAKIKAYRNNAVAFDGIAALTDSAVTTPFTIDEDDTDDPDAKGLVIVDGDPNKGTLDVIVKPLVTLFGQSI
jgi:hypothetical protein